MEKNSGLVIVIANDIAATNQGYMTHLVSNIKCGNTF